jgi:hypothetical protein
MVKVNPSGTFRRTLGHLSHALAKEKLEWWCVCGTQDSSDIKLVGIEMSHLYQSVLFASQRTAQHVAKVNYST